LDYRDSKVFRVMMARTEEQVRLDRKEVREQPEFRGHKDSRAFRVIRDLRVFKVMTDKQVRLVRLVRRELEDFRAIKVSRATRVIRVFREHRVTMARPGTRASKDSRDRFLRDLRDRKVSRDCRVASRDSKVCRVQEGFREPSVPMVHRVARGLPGLKDHRVRLGCRVTLEKLVA
jgi:hypothetical protein